MIKRKHIVEAFLLGGISGFAFAGKKYFKAIQEKTKKLETNTMLVGKLEEWIDILHYGKKIADYLKENEYHTVLIYGMGRLGRLLLDELEISDICVPAVIDRNAKKVFADANVISPDDEFPKADCIIVTPLTGSDGIKKMLREKADCTIISLEELFEKL